MARQPKADVVQASVAADDGKGLAPAWLVAKSAGSRRQIRALGESRKNIPIANCPASEQQRVDCCHEGISGGCLLCKLSLLVQCPVQRARGVKRKNIANANWQLLEHLIMG